MAGDHLLVEIRGEVLRLTINRPDKRNALSLALLDDLASALTQHTDTDELKCAVIGAAGDVCFAAGGDLHELDAVRSRGEAESMSQRGRRALDEVRFFPLPVIAALNGLALGGGAELAMACDLRVASSHAELGFLQGELNVTSAWGGGIDLVAAIGGPRALELLLAARRLSAREAHAVGLVNHVLPPDQSLEEGLGEFLSPYLRRGGPVLRGFKAIVAAHRRAVHDALYSVEQQHLLNTWTHPDHWAAVERSTARRRGGAD